MSHTPIPWKYEGTDIYKGEKDIASCIVTFSSDDAVTVSVEEAEANAAFIVKACDNYPNLVEAVRWAYARLLFLGEYEGRSTVGGQKELALLRDVIASVIDVDPEEIQNDYEEAALIKRYCKQAEAE